MNTQNTEFILVLLFINHCIAVHVNNCKPSVVSPYITYIITFGKICWLGQLIDRMLFFKKDFIYLFLEKGEGKEREKHQCVVASRAPYWGPSPQPRHVP